MIDQLNTPSLIGARVEVRRDQRRLGGAKYPGRTGVVIDENKFGRPEGLWHVRLEPTNRAKERTKLFWTGDLDVLSPAPAVEIQSVQATL
jgi:hypothetical protein